MIQLKQNSTVYSFDEPTGRLNSIEWEHGKLALDGIRFDIGCNEVNLNEFMVYDSLLEKHTWERPNIVPKKETGNSWPTIVNVSDNKLHVTYEMGLLNLTLIYQLTCSGVLSLTANVRNTSSETLYLNTLTLAPVLNAVEDVIFNFPANSPVGDYKIAELVKHEVISTNLVNFAIHTDTPGGKMNVLFIDSVEKWGTGVWHDGSKTYYTYSAALEANLAVDEELSVGTLYLQPCDVSNPYLQIRSFVHSLGYAPITDGIRTGVMYSCHPYGTMDGNFTSLRLNMRQYAEHLPALKEIGIDHVWLLPIFNHPEDTNGYHATDQAIIDKRYGTDEDVKHFCDEAHRLGMTVLFDYVPHGPAPELPLARDNPDWCAKRRDGSLQDEWNCVSFDYNHPGYLRYTSDLVLDHVKRFGIDGARIDCAMGGLSNWEPYGDNRPSASSVQAGVNISEATRRGFLEGGKTPLSMPENFNPVPPYFHCTDVFYGMTFYQVLAYLDKLFHDDPAKYVREIATWLEREKQTLPEELVKLRFLGNHDTVSWVWQKNRATEIYGLDGAKALWAFISLIDGMPMLYQGDEDSVLYGKPGIDLRDYFKNLFADRKKWISDDNKIEYLHTGTPIAAFYRGANKDCLVLVNFSKEANNFDASVLGSGFELVAGVGSLEGNTITVPAYSYSILAVK